MTKVARLINPQSAIRNPQSALALATLALTAGRAPAADDRYLNHHDLTTALSALAVAHPTRCALISIGKSRGGRDLWAMQVWAAGQREPENRPAILVVAGLAGDELTGSAIVSGELRRILEPAAPNPELDNLLANHTLYFLPRMNPDAAETYFMSPKSERDVVLRPRDDDRDGAVDEDGPEDINGDGLISLMRVKDAEKADMIPDPAEPRSLKKADAAKGETPVYKVYAEGLDNDGDEQFSEDPPGGVALHHNFPHGYREHADTSGPYALCETESRALVDFIVAHPRIAIVVEYGMHDNVIETPKGEKKDSAGAPIDLHSDDVAMYREIGETFRKLTELKNPPKYEASGAFFAWAYAQFGVPAFAIPFWTRPEVAKEEATSKPSGAATQPTDTQPASAPDAESRPAESQPAPASEPVTIEQVEQGMAELIHQERRRDENGKDKDKQKPEPDDKDAAAWLAYSDKTRAGAGFMAWTPFDHPQLGQVEIGGFVPFFRTAPPESELPLLIDRQLSFVLDLAKRFPSIEFRETQVKSLGPGVYEIETLLVNSGYFPTATAMGVQNRRVRPVVVTLDVPLERILGGERVTKVWSLPGSSGRRKFRWIVRGAAGENISIKVASEKLGDFTLDVPLPAAQ